ncbi:MAG: ribonuclease H-like domain-containing protein [Armatimonadetes bacterium]|nr:ribonuclease H-like domain-containing protein [Armatimonadota bacterium]
MLQKTFCHVPGIGSRMEQSLWEQGCDSWLTFLDRPAEFEIGTADRERAIHTVEKSVTALEEKDHQFFWRALGSKEAWRAWPEFRDRILYLDIETDGGREGDAVTMIGLYDGTTFTALTKGNDLANFPDMLSEAGMIVTFFGLGFDVPMLQRAFPRTPFDQIHLDLCFSLKRLGIRGGLKKIERQLGLSRSDETDGLTGLDAIRLWREHLRGDADALRILTEYNREDVVNLEHLAQVTYDRSLQALGRGSLFV